MGALMAPAPPRQYLHWIGESRPVPIPNPAKVHDIPVVGNATLLVQDMLVDSYSWTAGAAYKYYRGRDDEVLKAKFDEMDMSKNGRLSKKEVANALRELDMTEWQI